MGKMLSISDEGERGDVHFCEPWRHEEFDDWKFNVRDTEPEDSEVIKELEWDRTHRKWDEDYNCWTVDLHAFYVAYNHLSDNGYHVTFSEDLINAFGINVASSEAHNEDL